MRSTSSLTKPVIDSIDLENLLAMRETQRGLKDRLAMMDEAIAQSESQIIALIQEGADTSSCGHEIHIQESVRRYPSWKEHFISCMGKTAADAVLEATVPTIHRKLVVK